MDSADLLDSCKETLLRHVKIYNCALCRLCAFKKKNPTLVDALVTFTEMFLQLEYISAVFHFYPLVLENIFFF